MTLLVRPNASHSGGIVHERAGANGHYLDRISRPQLERSSASDHQRFPLGAEWSDGFVGETSHTILVGPIALMGPEYPIELPFELC